MPDIVMTDARKEIGYRKCISRYCREKELVGYWRIGVRARGSVIDVMLSHSRKGWI